MSHRTIGLLVMAYGTPRDPDEIEPYLAHIRHGRAPSPELLQDLKDRYHAIGGSSPLAAITEAQADKLAHALNARHAELTFKPYIGYKHTAPFIEDAVAAMRDDGITTAVSLVLAPHYSSMSVQAYNDRALASTARLDGPTLHTTSSWYQQPKFTRYWANQVSAALADIAAPERERTAVIFSAHSLPRRILDAHDPYPAQVRESAQRIAQLAGLAHYEMAWQSAGQTPEPWLGPDVRDVTRELWRTAGFRTFVYCPIGFVSDHLEVLFDNDVECRAVTDELGGSFIRPAMPNTDPLFIDCLRDTVSDRLADAARAVA